MTASFQAAPPVVSGHLRTSLNHGQHVSACAASARARPMLAAADTAADGERRVRRFVGRTSEHAAAATRRLRPSRELHTATPVSVPTQPRAAAIEHSVSVEIDVPIEKAFDLYSDLERMPMWSPWLKSVEVVDEKTSRWTITSKGFSVSWLARNTEVKKNEIIRWEAVDGLPNKGAIRFIDRTQDGVERVLVRMSVEYDIPGRIGEVVDRMIIGRLVESTLRSDLERFKEIVTRGASAADNASKA